jgi:hypothetical protein
MVDAVVEAVLGGSSMRVTLLPTGTISLLVNLAGVQCPSMGRKVGIRYSSELGWVRGAAGRGVPCACGPMMRSWESDPGYPPLVRGAT